MRSACRFSGVSAMSRGSRGIFARNEGKGRLGAPRVVDVEAGAVDADGAVEPNLLVVGDRALDARPDDVADVVVDADLIAGADDRGEGEDLARSLADVDVFLNELLPELGDDQVARHDALIAPPRGDTGGVEGAHHRFGRVLGEAAWQLVAGVEQRLVRQLLAVGADVLLPAAVLEDRVGPGLAEERRRD